jgi:hypothetical protein
VGGSGRDVAGVMDAARAAVSAAGAAKDVVRPALGAFGFDRASHPALVLFARVVQMAPPAEPAEGAAQHVIRACPRRTLGNAGRLHSHGGAPFVLV